MICKEKNKKYTEENKLKEISNKETLEILNKLDENKKNDLLNWFKVSEIAQLCMEEGFLDKWINIYAYYVDVFEDLREITKGKSVKSKAEKIYDEYMSLDKESKKEFNILIDSQLKPLAFFAKHLLNK